MRRLTIVAVALATVAVACTPQGDGPTTPPGGNGTLGGQPITLAAALVSFDACEDYLAYVKAEALERVGPYGLEGFGGGIVVDQLAGMEQAAGEPADDAARAFEAPVPVAEPGVDYSTTNVQEAGVDEPDVVKTDGRLLAAVIGDRVHLVDVSAGAPQRLGSIKVDGWDARLLLVGDRLLVVGRAGWGDVPTAQRPAGLSPDRQWMPVTTLSLYDLADPANPRLETTTRFDGDFVNARLVDGIARVVLRSSPADLPFVYPSSGQQEALDRAAASNREVVEQSTIENWLPRYVRHDPATGVTDEGYALDCADIRHPVEFSGFGMLSVLTLDLRTGLQPGPSVGVLAEGDTVYASSTGLYVATTRWSDRPMPMPMPMPMPEIDVVEPAELDAPVEPADPDAPDAPDAVEPADPDAPDAPVEPVDPDARIMPEPVPAPDSRTQVHKFDISDPTTAVYRASGEVPGRLLNQFALSEHDGHLRVAVTTGQMWGPDDESESAVHVLAEQDGRLVEVGMVGGLGKGERIYAVRYMGPVGYVVTFRETDPLYTLDLSVPTAPRVLGELKILGYSAYLHPIGEGLLLGVGQDATEEGLRLGTQLSVFDVRDLANPTRLHQVTLGEGSGSEIEYDHHAFLWWAPRDLAVVPVSRWHFEARAERFESAAIGFTVTDGGIAEVGRVSHPAPGPQREILDDGEEFFYDEGWRAQIRRSLVVGDRLYTLSDAGLGASDLGSFADVAFVGW